MRHFEVVILGGGPAGCATALSLLAQGVAPESLLVVEASHFERERIGESLSPDTRRLLDALGVLPAFLAQGHEPCYGSASSWGGDELGYNDFMFHPYGNGWHLDRRRFDAWLAAEVEVRGVALRTGLRFLKILEQGASRVVLALGVPGEIREQVCARFVVDATGRRSLYARRMGARQRELDMLVSVAAFFTLSESSSFAKLTFLEAVEYGWWYTARLPNQRIATAVATAHALYKERRFDHPRVWLEALAQTRYVAGVLTECELVADSFSACTVPSFVLQPVYGGRWLAVGDAASAYDPISSRGIFNALSDGLTGGRAIAAHLAGEPTALSEYQAHLEARFEEYARQRAYFYDQERRWSDAPFWSGRRSRTLSPSP